jgi:hypothetical protein
MYKKLMFLISLVCLLGLSAGVRAEEVEVGNGETLVIDSAVEIDDFKISGDGVIIVTSTGTFTVNNESTMGDGSGETPRLFVDGGVMYMNDRVNVGKDGASAHIFIVGGGYFEHHGEKVTVPDDSGGEHRIIVRDGIFLAEEVEMIWDRDAALIMGCGSPGTKFETCGIYDNYSSRDPEKWLEEDALECEAGCVGPEIVDLDADCTRVFCLEEPNEAYLPCPEDGATEVPVDVCLTWRKGALMGGHVGDKHYVYWSTSETDVTNDIVGGDSYQQFLPVGLEEFCPVGQVLWTTYYWRVDEKPFQQTTFKGNIWSYTTGCEMVPGDINLDCFVDGLDWAMLADDWMVESFFPDDF